MSILFRANPPLPVNSVIIKERQRQLGGVFESNQNIEKLLNLSKDELKQKYIEKRNDYLNKKKEIDKDNNDNNDIINNNLKFDSNKYNTDIINNKVFSNIDLFDSLESNDKNNKKKLSKIHLNAIKLRENYEKNKEKLKSWNPKKDTNIFGKQDYTLFIGNLDFNVTEQVLDRNFRIYGKIENLRIVKDMEENSRGYAFIEYKNKEDCKEAYRKAHNQYIENRRIIVDYDKGRFDKYFVPTRLGGWNGYKRRNTSSFDKVLHKIYHSFPELKTGNLCSYRRDLEDKKLNKLYNDTYKKNNKDDMNITNIINNDKFNIKDNNSNNNLGKKRDNLNNSNKNEFQEYCKGKTF